MNAMAQQVTSSTPLSDEIAPPFQRGALPLPEQSDLERPAWLEPVIDQMVAILRLKEGWDGYRAGPIRQDVVTFARHVFAEIMLPNSPAPQITPMSHEGLMIEWHQNGIDLEIEVERPGSLWVSFEDHVENIDEEMPLFSNLERLVTPIEKLTKRAVVHG